jgi:Ser/Thr protein kinase RdoA (MazF antagonist)
MPEDVLNALRRFEVEARANVLEGMHTRARAATGAYNETRERSDAALEALPRLGMAETGLRAWACRIRSAPGDRQGVGGASPLR